jgi:phosphoglycolate phosphatase
MTPMPDSLIFDLDGTLWTTVALCTRAWNQVLGSTQLSRRLSEADVAATMGLTSAQVEKQLFPTLSSSAATALIDQCFKVEIALLREHGGILYADVESGLAQLAKKFPLFLVSNCEIEYLDAFVLKSGLASYFRDSECHGRTRKSKGENISTVMKRNGLTSPVYIGDTKSDEEAAAVAGIPFGFAEYGFGKCKYSDFRFERFEKIVSTFCR